MSLPVTEVERELTHTRRVRYEGYKRTDGLWDIEAHLTDVKNNDYPLKSGGRRGGATPPALKTPRLPAESRRPPRRPADPRDVAADHHRPQAGHRRRGGLF